MTDAVFRYRWTRLDSHTDEDIEGATGSTYTVAAADEGKTIRVRVSFTDAAGNSETLTSAATAAVAGAQPTEPPAKPRDLEATATHDSVTLTWDDPRRRLHNRLRDPQAHSRGSTPRDSSENWSPTRARPPPPTQTTRCLRRLATPTGSRRSTGQERAERSRWAHIDVPAAPQEQAAEPPDKPTGLEATVSHGQVVLTWDDPGDDSITGYVILRRVRVNDQGGDFSVLVADTGSAATTYTDDTVAAGLTYTYRIKAINEHGTSERSRWYHIDTPEDP